MRRLEVIFPLLVHSQRWMCQIQFRFCLLAEFNNKLRFTKKITYRFETIEEVVEVVDGGGGTAFPDVDVWL